MTTWKPSEKERHYLELVMSMTTDCLMGRGVDSVETYVSNLNRITGQIFQQSVQAESDSLCKKCKDIGRNGEKSWNCRKCGDPLN